MGKKIANYQNRVCPICEKEFVVNISLKRENSKKTCGSKSCSAKLGALNIEKIKVKCKVCSTEFDLSRSKVYHSGNYCSDKCRNSNYEHSCEICGVKFTSDRNTTRFCSTDCISESNKRTLKSVNCACCGLLFSRPSSTLSQNKRFFCSKRCAQKQFARENPKRYGSNWSRIRERKAIKDNYTCNRCGIQTFEKYALNVHHIIPIEEFEDVNDAHYEGNLETLCYECHMEHHDKEILIDNWYR